MPIKRLKIFELEWLHISPLEQADVEYLEKTFKFHPLDMKDCLEGVQRPKLDTYPKYLFIIFHFPMFDTETSRVGINSLNVFVGKNFLITISNQPDPELDEYFKKMTAVAKRTVHYDPLKNSAGYLLYKIIESRYKSSLPLVNDVGRRIEEVEDDVFSDRNKEATTNLAILRRNLLNLRRILEPQLKMVDRLVGMHSYALPEKLSVYFDDVHDYMENAWSALENYRETINGLYETNESLINQRTNEVIKTLTTISVALLPMTLLASIYGMNVQGLPFADHPIGLWLIFGLMAGIVWASIYVARRNKII